jgi:hypothetical protein
MPHKTYIHRPTVLKDLSIIAAVNFFLFILFTQIDVLEQISYFPRDYEAFQLDAVIP